VTLRLLAPLALLLAAAVAAGCGGDDAPEVPDGFARVQRPAFAIAHPEGWQVRDRPSQSGDEQVTEMLAAGSPAGVQVLVGATPRFSGGFDGLIELNDADTRLRLPQRREVARSEPEVAGAQRARLVEWELPAGAPGAAPVPTRAFDLVALSEDGTAVNVFARVPAAEVDRSRVRDVLGSLALR
jgi:hypothetical protein